MSDKYHKYQVIVGNVGTVYSGQIKASAIEAFEQYRRKSIDCIGRAAGESVTLVADGEIERDHAVDSEDDHHDGVPKCKALADTNLSAYDCDCEACKAIVASIDGRSWKEQIEIAEGLDGGGYEIDEVEPMSLPPALRDIGIDYSIGETELGEIMPDIEGEIGYVMSDADHAPETIEEIDGDGEIIGYRELAGTYWISERDGECYCVSGDSCEWGDAPPGRYFDREGNLRLCERCGGGSIIDCPGYEFATYGEAIHFEEWIANNEIPDGIEGRWFIRRDGNGWKGSADAAAGGPAEIRIVPAGQSLPKNYARVWSREIGGKRYSGWTDWQAGSGAFDSGTFDLPFRGAFRFQIYR